MTVNVLPQPIRLSKSPSENSLDENKIQMKKQLGLLEGVAIILGIIFGSGIFVSPKGVLLNINSVGASLVIWVICGFLSMIGAMCYAELGTSIPQSGGDYAYIHEAFGSLPAFLYLWSANLIFVPTTNAIMALTFAQYVIQPFFPNCSTPGFGTQLIAAVTICFLTFINCYDVKETSRMQNVFMFAKIGALVTIIVGGIFWLMLGNVENFENSFQNTNAEPGKIATAIYLGIYSYSGWNYLNFMTEELKDPYVNLPRAIYISLPLVTLAYVLANIAYLSVLTPMEIISSDAIAVTFGDQLLGFMAWIMPVMVAISAFGGLSVHIMTSSRMCFVGARNGHFPSVLSHINMKRFTPTPALIFLCILSLAMLCTSDVHELISYCTIVETFFIMLSVAGILWLRYKKPEMARPIKMPIWIPTTYVGICIFLVLMPFYEKPYQVAIAAIIILFGIPAYFIGVMWDNKPMWLQNINVKSTHVVQKLFVSAMEERDC